MNKETSASAIRYEQQRAEIVRRMAIHGGERTQAEMIARHYTALATVALELLRLCEMRKRVGSSPESNQIIDYLVDTIKKTHWDDFGIPLEWKETNNSHKQTSSTILAQPKNELLY